MSAMTGLSVALALMVVGAGLSLWDLQRDARTTLVVYTTPALRDLLERDIIPRFERETGLTVSLVYAAVGQQYNRLRMGGEDAEADLFLHASPLYLEKGYAGSHVQPMRIAQDAAIPDALRSDEVDGGRIWYAFAWSPLVVVYPRSVAKPPDLATSDASFGFAHPLLSNNGVYNVILFEEVSPVAGARAITHTRSQPTNARANIGGVADGSFELTLGYEAVVKFYQGQGAKVSYALPVIDGATVTTPVLCSVALIAGHPNPHAEELVRFLFTDETQSRLGASSFRSVLPNMTVPEGLVDVDAPDVELIHYDWSQWRDLEKTLPRYEVRG